ncbi:MAG TPA: Hpt domain-containing protein [Pirellulales bacterium]|nr:Hpt domain-containing protein [Pirellulales bacterium]
MSHSGALEASKDSAVVRRVEANPALELDQLVRRCMGCTALAARLLDSFEKRFSAEVAQLVQAVDDGDVPRLVRLTHQLKGAAGNVSAMTLHSVLSRMEEAARAQSLDLVVASLKDLFDQWNCFLECKASATLSLASLQASNH